MDPLDLLAIGMQPSGGDAGALGAVNPLDMFKRPQMSPEQMRRSQAIQGIAGALDAPAQQPAAAPQPAGAAPARMPLQASAQPAPLPVQNQFPMAPRRPGGMMAMGAGLPIMGVPYG